MGTVLKRIHVTEISVMSIFDCSARDVLTVCVFDEGRAGVEFLNWRIAALPMNERVRDAESFAGPGIYGLCFDDALIYIGSYLGVGSSAHPLSGDVVTSRWWAHIASITARGHKVHVARTSIKALSAEFGDAHPLVSGLNGASSPALLHKDAGCLSPLRRLRFAAERWDQFCGVKPSPDALMGRFQFVYAHPRDLQHREDVVGLRSDIVAKERELIGALAPACNAAHVPRGQASVPVNLTDAKICLEEAVADI